MYEAKSDLRGSAVKCFQCSGTHRFWECPCRHCSTCNKMNAHLAVDCPKLSQERKREWSDWKSSYGQQQHASRNPPQVGNHTSAVRVRTPAVILCPEILLYELKVITLQVGRCKQCCFQVGNIMLKIKTLCTLYR